MSVVKQMTIIAIVCRGGSMQDFLKGGQKI